MAKNIDYNTLSYSDFTKFEKKFEEYKQHLLSKPPLEKIRLRYYTYSRDIKDLDIDISGHKKNLIETTRISNMPPIEIKKDVIYGLALSIKNDIIIGLKRLY